MEVISLLIALLAVAISLVSLVRSRETAKKQLELQQSTARLASRQLQDYEERDKAQVIACLDCTLEQRGKNDWRIVIANVGEAPAAEVRLSWLDKPEVLVQGELEEKFPLATLEPGKSISLIAAITYDVAPPIDVQLEWKHPDKSRAMKRYVLHFP